MTRVCGSLHGERAGVRLACRARTRAVRRARSGLLCALRLAAFESTRQGSTQMAQTLLVLSSCTREAPRTPMGPAMPRKGCIATAVSLPQACRWPASRLLGAHMPSRRPTLARVPVHAPLLSSTRSSRVQAQLTTCPLAPPRKRSASIGACGACLGMPLLGSLGCRRTARSMLLLLQRRSYAQACDMVGACASASQPMSSSCGLLTSQWGYSGLCTRSACLCECVCWVCTRRKSEPSMRASCGHQKRRPLHCLSAHAASGYLNMTATLAGASLGPESAGAPQR